MNITTFRLAIKSTRYRKTALILSIISIAFSVVLLLGIERIRRSIETSFTNTISGTDLIVGARTGNLSLLLSTVFHRGNNTKGISWTSYQTIASNPQVDWTIPIVLGDSHKGFAVVGTNSDFFKHYRYGPNLPLETKNGQLVLANMKTVIGAKVAEALAYNVDDAIVLTHGMGTEDFSNHKDNPFTVSAILKPTGTPIDNSVLVLMNDLDHIHNEFYNQDIDPFAAMESADDHLGHNHDAHGSHPKTLTGFFVGVKNKSNILQLQKAINDSTSEALMAIMPVVTLLELWSVINPIENILKLISFVVLFISLGSMLTTLLTSLNQRRREMSILRSLGARPQLIFGLIILESVGIVLSGILLGICLLIVALTISQPLFSQNFGIRVDLWVANLNEIYILLAILISGLLIGLFPAIQCYKQALGDGLTIKH